MGSILKEIMIFEDSDVIRTSLTYYLKKMGYIIYEASNSESALKTIQENDIALFIVNIDTPDEERIKFFSAINSNKVTRNVPVIMISSEYNCNIIEEYDNTGVRSWMINTFDAVKLFSTIKNLMTM